MELSPYDKMRLKRQSDGRPAVDPAAVRAVKKNAQTMATFRARKVLEERHKEEYVKLRADESRYLRALVEQIYDEGITDEYLLRDEFFRRANNP